MWFLFKPLSWVLGLVDLSFLGLSLLGKRRSKFFRSGWGDLSIPYTYQNRILKALETGKPPESFQLTNKIEWLKETHDSSVVIKQAQFLSPVADLLPQEAKYCRFHLISPLKSDDDIEPVYVIMLPATGEMGKSTRLRMAKTLADQCGWSSVIVTAPFYGARKPKNQKLFFIETVTDILLQSQAISQEAGALGSYFLNLDSRNKVCITGFSWGAAMSAISSAFTLLSVSDGSRLACVPYVGSASPSVIVEGIISNAVDWEALKASGDQPQENVRRNLLNEFQKTQLSEITDSLQQSGRNRIGVVKAIAAYDDHFIRRPSAKDFFRQMKALGSAASNISTMWIPGGHVIALLLRPYFQKKAIIEAVRELKKIS